MNGQKPSVGRVVHYFNGAAVDEQGADLPPLVGPFAAIITGVRDEADTIATSGIKRIGAGGVVVPVGMRLVLIDDLAALMALLSPDPVCTALPGWWKAQWQKLADARGLDPVALARGRLCGVNAETYAALWGDPMSVCMSVFHVGTWMPASPVLVPYSEKPAPQHWSWPARVP